MIGGGVGGAGVRANVLEVAVGLNDVEVDLRVPVLASRAIRVSLSETINIAATRKKKKKIL